MTAPFTSIHPPIEHEPPHPAEMANKSNGNGRPPHSSGTHRTKTKPPLDRHTTRTPTNNVTTPSQKILAVLSQAGYAFRLNDMNDAVEVNGEPLSDAHEAVLHCHMRDHKFSNMKAVDDVITSDAYQHKYHPIKDYLDALHWNGRKNIAELATYFTDEHGYMNSFLRKWLIGAIGKVYGTMQNPMLVLVGPQKLGKSNFVKWLCPLPSYHLESPINPDDKDNDVRLMSYWLWEVGELDATTRRADVAALKFFLTKTQVTVRKSYGRRDTVKPALSSFIGTLNPDGGGFLHDNTGERRFRPVTLSKIDWTYTTLDIPQIWAEAMDAYRHGETNELSADEDTTLRTFMENEYKSPDPVEQLILRHFAPTEKWEDDQYPVSEVQRILESAGLKGTTRQNALAIAQAMTTLGVRRGSTGKVRYWSGLHYLASTEENPF